MWDNKMNNNRERVKGKVLPRFELGSKDSESCVIPLHYRTFNYPLTLTISFNSLNANLILQSLL